MRLLTTSGMTRTISPNAPQDFVRLRHIAIRHRQDHQSEADRHNPFERRDVAVTSAERPVRPAPGGVQGPRHELIREDQRHQPHPKWDVGRQGDAEDLSRGAQRHQRIDPDPETDRADDAEQRDHDAGQHPRAITERRQIRGAVAVPLLAPLPLLLAPFFFPLLPALPPFLTELLPIRTPGLTPAVLVLEARVMILGAVDHFLGVER